MLDTEMLAASTAASHFVDTALADDSVSASSTIDSAQWRLAALMFQHKWTDIILSDAIAQARGRVSVSLRDHFCACVRCPSQRVVCNNRLQFLVRNTACYWATCGMVSADLSLTFGASSVTRLRLQARCATTLTACSSLLNLKSSELWCVHAGLFRCVPKFWTHRTIVYCFCDTSVREKAWRSRKRVAQAT